MVVRPDTVRRWDLWPQAAGGCLGGSICQLGLLLCLFMFPTCNLNMPAGHPNLILRSAAEVANLRVRELPEVRSQESGVRSQESGIRSQESGVRSQESHLITSLWKFSPFVVCLCLVSLRTGTYQGSELGYDLYEKNIIERSHIFLWLKRQKNTKARVYPYTPKLRSIWACGGLSAALPSSPSCLQWQLR